MADDAAMQGREGQGMEKQSLIPVERIERSILLIRGHKVMLDSDLAELYGVTTKRLNEQVKRNLSRFPDDFMFQLTESETYVLRSQYATSKKGRGGRRYLPYVFTEQGVAMLSSVLNSERAIKVNIEIMRAFRPVAEDSGIPCGSGPEARCPGEEIRCSV